MAKRRSTPATRGGLLWHAFVQAKWAVTEPVFATLQQMLANRRSGVLASEEELTAARAIREAREAAAAARQQMAAAGNVYVVPVCGIITQRSGLFTDYSGGCSVEDLVSEVREAMAMPSVAAVLLDFDSPGGSCYGVMEAFDALKAMRGTKPLVALCDPLAASAAYWLASACDSIYCIPSGEAGSIGVYVSHTDYSGMNMQIGIDVSYVYAGRYKVEGNPYEPLSGEARAYLQQNVDDTYAEFVADVAEGRGVSTDTVIKSFGEGRVLLAAEAKQAGLVDDIRTFDQVVQQLTSPAPGRKGRRGAVVPPIAPKADHTDVGRGTDGKFASQCECHADCACMQGGSQMCAASCQTCVFGCACTATPLEDPMESHASARSTAKATARQAGVIPKDVSDTLAPKDTPWSKLTLQDFTDKSWGDLSADEQRKIAGHFAWAAEMPPASFGDLKLGHHRPSDGAVVYHGVTACLADLNGAHGTGVDIPDADKVKVRAHLDAHEKAFQAQDDADATARLRDQMTVQAHALAARVRR